MIAYKISGNFNRDFVIFLAYAIHDKLKLLLFSIRIVIYVKLNTYHHLLYKISYGYVDH